MKPLLWNLGWVVLILAWLGPLPFWAGYSFAAHMTLHMAVVAVAAPLLSIAAAGCRYDPVRRWPRFFSPLPASLGELVIVWAWHAPGLHHFARHSTIGLVIEQSMFLAAGVWVWLSAFGGRLPRSRSRSGAGVIALLLTSMHMTFLGALLAMSPRLLYVHHHGGGGLPPLLDQHIGGAVMLVVGGIAFLAGGLWLTRDLLLTSPRQASRPPAQASRPPAQASRPPAPGDEPIPCGETS
ncbi:cytochrome c oxidase assembly protein [Roseimaritima sediminicola]|uniref:cytochrome c oxidase assembly protein n=1 Tax=Roseimaritima sediminicola TaxID=2662066 RepID=UPI001F38D93F|nr:cytochrome c oxidase assembly protein [Roseimaritima sediminicola]